MKRTYNLEKLDKLTKEMFGEKYTFNKMSQREKGMIKKYTITYKKAKVLKVYLTKPI